MKPVVVREVGWTFHPRTGNPLGGPCVVWHNLPLRRYGETVEATVYARPGGRSEGRPGAVPLGLLIEWVPIGRVVPGSRGERTETLPLQ